MSAVKEEMPLSSQIDASDGLPYLVDAHIHVWSTDFQKYPLAHDVSPEQLKPRDHSVEYAMEQGRPLGIKKAVLVAHDINLGTDFSYLIDMKVKYPDMFGVVAWLGDNSTDVGAKVKKLKGLGVDGLRVIGARTENWIESPSINEMWQVAGSENIAICPLVRIKSDKQFTMNALSHIAKLCEKHPETKVVLDHMAHIQLSDDSVAEEQLKQLARNPNVYVKVSRFRKFSDDPQKRTRAPYLDFVPLITRLIDSFGVERLMWASDRPSLYQEPGNLLRASLAVVQEALALTESERDWMLRKTAESVFFQTDNGPSK